MIRELLYHRIRLAVGTVNCLWLITSFILVTRATKLIDFVLKYELESWLMNVTQFYVEDGISSAERYQNNHRSWCDDFLISSILYVRMSTNEYVHNIALDQTFLQQMSVLLRQIRNPYRSSVCRDRVRWKNRNTISLTLIIHLMCWIPWCRISQMNTRLEKIDGIILDIHQCFV